MADSERATRALSIIERLHERGARVRAYDPMAIDVFRRLTDLPIEDFDNRDDALRDADLAIVQSDWKEIRGITPEEYRELLKNPVVIDGRRSYDPIEMISNGVRYYGIGWKNIY